MKIIIRFFTRIVLFVLLLFVFLVLFQYGPSRFWEGAMAEAKWVQSLLKTSENKPLKKPETSTTEKAQTPSPTAPEQKQP